MVITASSQPPTPPPPKNKILRMIKRKKINYLKNVPLCLANKHVVPVEKVLICLAIVLVEKELRR